MTQGCGARRLSVLHAVKYDVKCPHKRQLALNQTGPAFEQWLILQLIYLNRVLRKDLRLSSYRTESGAEVDLVIEREDDILAIEIKAGRNVSRSDTRGLFSLAEVVGKYKPLKKWLLCTGKHEQLLENGVRVLPYIKGLEELREA